MRRLIDALQRYLQNSKYVIPAKAGINRINHLQFGQDGFRLKECRNDEVLQEALQPTPLLTPHYSALTPIAFPQHILRTDTARNQALSYVHCIYDVGNYGR